MALPLFRDRSGPDTRSVILGGDSPQVGWFPGSRPPRSRLEGQGLSAAPARTLLIHFHEHLASHPSAALADRPNFNRSVATPPANTTPQCAASVTRAPRGT